MKHFVAPLFLLLSLSTCEIVLPQQAQAQLRFYDLDEKGLSGSVIYGSSSTDINLGGSFGYAPQGRLFLGLSGGYSWLDKDDYGSSGHAMFFGPHAFFAVLKPDAEQPLGLEFQAGFEFTSLNAKQGWGYGLEASGHTLNAGLSLYLDLKASENLHIYPTFGLDYLRGALTTSGFYGGGEALIDDLAYSGGLSFLIQELMQINAQLVSFEGNWSGALSIGFVSLKPAASRPSSDATREIRELDPDLPY